MKEVMMEEKNGRVSVTVTLEETRDGPKPKCVPDPVEVVKGDIIEWSCAPGLPLGIFIERLDTPLDQNVYCAQPGGTISATVVTAPAEPGGEERYKYTVATTDGIKFRHKDPEIIVRRPR